jgi:hypothetical protein
VPIPRLYILEVVDAKRADIAKTEIESGRDAISFRTINVDIYVQKQWTDVREVARAFFSRANGLDGASLLKELWLLV